MPEIYSTSGGRSHAGDWVRSCLGPILSGSGLVWVRSCRKSLRRIQYAFASAASWVAFHSLAKKRAVRARVSAAGQTSLAIILPVSENQIDK
eukprot:scaffold154_cov286-Pinguiococcus_pyrenoidosus.AAC.7